MVEENAAAKHAGGAPAHKKKGSLLRDVFKLYQLISKLWPRDKQRIKTKSKIKPESETHDVVKEIGDGGKEEGVKLCRVRSYRCDRNVDGLSNKPSISRSLSHNRIGGHGDKASSNLTRTASGFRRSTTTTPILFSSSGQSLIKPRATEENLECTLEELCKGCTKKIKIKRDVINSVTGQITQEEEMVKIEVKPGWKNGTKVTFEGKGNEAPGRLPSDLTFVVAEKEHELLRREGDHLEMEVEIPLVEALTGSELFVSLPDGEKMRLRIDDVIQHEHVEIIQGRGMPKAKELGERGDLRVRFRVKFPRQLTEDQRADIRSILEDST